MRPERYEKLIEIDVTDEADRNLPIHGPLTAWRKAFDAAVEAAHRQYQALSPLEEAQIHLDINWHRGHGDDGEPELEITLSGCRYETPQEAEARYRESREYQQEQERLAAQRKEQAERAELARLKAKYRD